MCELRSLPWMLFELTSSCMRWLVLPWPMLASLWSVPQQKRKKICYFCPGLEIGDGSKLNWQPPKRMVWIWLDVVQHETITKFYQILPNLCSFKTCLHNGMTRHGLKTSRDQGGHAGTTILPLFSQCQVRAQCWHVTHRTMKGHRPPGLTFSHFSRQVGKTLPADKIPDLDKKAVCDGAAQSHSLWQPLTLWANVAGAGCWHRCRCCQERLDTRAKIGRNMKRVMETFTTKARAAQHCPWHMLELGSARHVFHRFPIMELLPWLISQKSDNLGIREAQCSWCQHAQLSGVSFRQTCYQRSWVHFFFWAQDRWIDRIKLTRLAQLWHWRLSLLASMVKQSQSYSEANSIALIHACDLCPI